uniref:Putative DnaJ (Hsp40) homolog, subfamily C, member 2 n=1 Tax=Schistosoma japonicum TaxID=6182 RepID=C7TYI6_SCHJA|nr:putative DnaJ (Hsp40) homolog, subfamily C, member 2 [Schistosoma japonicum]
MQNESLALGVVKSIHKLYLEIQLPHGFLGRVNIYDISDKYTELLRESAETGVIHDDLVELSEMFKVGQIVRCFIKESDNSRGGGSNKRYLVSLNPKMVNKSVISKNLKPYMVFVGSIVSNEDHGYIVDSGVPRMSCFLPKDQVDDNPNIGSLIAFTPYVSDPSNFVSSTSDRVSKVTTRLDPTLSVLKSNSRVNFDCILPGTCLNASIVKKVTSVLVAEFSDYFISVPRSHYDGCKEDYQIGANVVVCIIFVDPSAKQLTGSLLPHLVNPIPSILKISELLFRCPVGTRFSGSLVERVNKRAVLVKLPKTNGSKAVIRIHKTETKNNENFKSLAVGSKLTCRIIGHDFLENVAVATINKKLLTVPFLSLNELKPGYKVLATVKRYSKTGIVVHIEGRLHGLIPYLHTTDINLKEYKEKFKAGEKVSCIVLQLDECANKLILTAKPGLVNSEFPVFGSREMYTALEKGNTDRLLVIGFVVKVSEKGLLISGLDNVRGWIPKRETGLADEDILQTNFYRGQVLKMKFKREINISPTNQMEGDNQSIRSKYMFSLKFHSKKVKSSQSIFLDSVHIGQRFSATVNRVEDTGISVNLYATKDSNNTMTSVLGTGFLSFSQLSDYESNQQLLCRYTKNMKSGSTLDWNNSAREVVVIDKGKQTVIVSARPTLIWAAGNPKIDASNDVNMVDLQTSTTMPGFLRTFDELQIGGQWFAWVSHHKDYGVFVRFPAGIYGLAPKHLLSDFRAPSNTNWAELFPVGATVIAKIVEVTPEKRHCLASLRMLDMYNAKQHYVGMAIHSLNYYLTEREWISQKHELLGSFRIGDRVHFKVESLENSVIFGMACRQPVKNAAKQLTWVPAMAYVANSVNIDCIVSQTYSAIVCFVDHEQSRLEIVLSSWLVNGILTRKNNVSSLLKTNQQISSVVLAYRNRDIAVLGLRGHATGLLGVVPSRRTFNDIAGGNAWVIGQRNKVTYRESFKQENSLMELKLCTLTIYDPIEGNNQVKTANKQNNPISLVNENLNGAPTTPNFITFQAGQQLSDLYFISISSQTAFFAVGSINGPHVYCHLINWDNSVKSIRSFLSNPPEAGTRIDRIATILFSYIDDKLIAKRKNAGFRSRISEITFLKKPTVSVGELVCAQISRLKSDYWTVFLPGRANGRLHITDMNHSDLNVKPLDLTETSLSPELLSSSSKFFNIHENSNQIKAHYFITCRIVDQYQHVHMNADDIDDVNDEVIYFVSNKVKLLRDPFESSTEQQSSNKMPDFDIPTNGFVKSVHPHGLKLCLFRTIDILIPFPPNLKTRLEICGIHFKVGDHLLVCPKWNINEHLVGELICNNSNNCEHIEEDSVNKLMRKLLNELTDQKQAIKSRKRELVIYDDLDETTSSLESGNFESTSTMLLTDRENIPEQKKCKTKSTMRKLPPVTLHGGSQSRKRKRTYSNESTQSPPNDENASKNSKKKQSCIKDENSLLNDKCMNNSQNKKPSDQLLIHKKTSSVSLNGDNIFSKTLLKRYERFMFPRNENESDGEMQITQTLESKDSNNKHLNVESNHEDDNLATKEWRLRDMEMRKAILAALTSEQQYLPKGQLHPQTTEEFELAVRNMPSNEACWIAYMTHLLSGKIGQQTNNSGLNKGVIEARAIAERGLRAISNSASNNLLVKQSSLLISYLIMEAKELERLTCLQKQQQYHLSSSSISVSDLVMEINNQSKRVSQLLTQLLNLDQAPFIRRAIDTLSDIGHHTRAEELARRQIKSHPVDVDHWLSLIKARFRAGNVEAAREAQRNAASLLKSSILPQLAIGVARIEFDYGDIDRGIRLLQEQLTIHPKRKLLYEECIKLLLLNNKIKEARTIQQQAEKNLKPVQCSLLNSLFEGQVTC